MKKREESSTKHFFNTDTLNHHMPKFFVYFLNTLFLFPFRRVFDLLLNVHITLTDSIITTLKVFNIHYLSLYINRNLFFYPKTNISKVEREKNINLRTQNSLTRCLVPSVILRFFLRRHHFSAANLLPSSLRRKKPSLSLFLISNLPLLPPPRLPSTRRSASVCRNLRPVSLRRRVPANHLPEGF